MEEYKISEDQLIIAKEFFSSDNIDALTKQSRKINTTQPNFSAVVLALEMYGLNRVFVEDILESIFVVYFVQTELRKKNIAKISTVDIEKNIKWFGDFIMYYNMEKECGTADLEKIKFLRDDTVLRFAIATLQGLFGDYKKIPWEVVISYFALLKGIEMGAEKG